MTSMARFEIRIDSPLSALDAWARILDLRAHSAVIPLTTVTGDTLDAARLTPGSRFSAQTRLGPVGFDDPMVFDEVRQPIDNTPGYARISKHGNLVHGGIELTVTPNDGGSVVVWRQNIAVRYLPAFVDPLTALVGKAAYGATVRKLLARP